MLCVRCRLYSEICHGWTVSNNILNKYFCILPWDHWCQTLFGLLAARASQAMFFGQESRGEVESLTQSLKNGFGLGSDNSPFLGVPVTDRGASCYLGGMQALNRAHLASCFSCWGPSANFGLRALLFSAQSQSLRAQVSLRLPAAGKASVSYLCCLSFWMRLGRPKWEKRSLLSDGQLLCCVVTQSRFWVTLQGSRKPSSDFPFVSPIHKTQMG